MPRKATVTAILLCLITTSLLAGNDALIRKMRDRAKEAIEDGEATTATFKPMIDMLRKSKDDDDQRQLVDVIVDFGRHDGSSPSAIKKYINEEMTPILLALAENRKNSTFLRGDAIHGLRNMGASRAALEQVTKMALADSDGFVQSRGEILENYLKSLPAEAPAAESIKPVDEAKEKEALKFLKSRKLGASPEQLHRSSMEGKADEVRALLAAGVPVDADNGAALIGAMSACSSEGETAELVEVVGVLVDAGANLKRLDENRNTPLITAAQYCGDKVVSKLVAAGADVNATNGTGMTPVMIAIFSNRYEAAEALVAKGAKLTKDQAAMVSAMPDPRAKALAQKASRKK